MSGLKAVILDIDGTLIDSNDAHTQAFVDAAAELGLDGAGFDEIRKMIGMGGDKLIPRAFGFEEESPDGERLSEAKGRIFEERYLPEIRPTPGARELLERLRAEGYTLVVATSAGGDVLDGLLRAAGVRDLIEDATSASDVEDSKPEPDAVKAALRKAGARPDEAVMLGDTPYDVEAATRAGVVILAVRTGGWDDAALDGAAGIYDHPADLLARYAESPLARG